MGLDSNQNRIRDLENRLAQLKQQLRAGGQVHARLDSPIPVRLARTAAAEGQTYPDATATVYPIVFLDGTYDQADQAAAADWTLRQQQARAVLFNLGATFIPEGTVVTAFWKNNRWWTHWCCAGCITCKRDSFNRANNSDISVDAPYNWLTTPSETSIASNRAVMSTAGTVNIFDEGVQLGVTVDYTVKLFLIEQTDGDEIILFTSRNDATNYYACQYTVGDKISIYQVVAGVPTLLNEILVSDSFGAHLFLAAKVSFETMQVEFTIQGDNASEFMVAPYSFNGGDKVGFGCNTLAGASATVDDFSLCENKCPQDCLIVIDTFNRDDADNVDTGSPGGWRESPANPSNGIDITSQELVFTTTGTVYCLTPHPQGYSTMAVFTEIVFTRLSFFPKPYAKILVGVDDPADPKSWVEVTFNPNTGQVTIAQQWNGGSTGLATAAFSMDSGVRYEYQVCVGHDGQVTAYARLPGIARWTPLVWATPPQAMGAYCGLSGQGVVDQKHVEFDNFVFVKTWRPPTDHILTFTVGGTIEADDQFAITVTRNGVTATAIIPAGDTDPDIVAKNIVDGILALDPLAYPGFAALTWIASGFGGQFTAGDDRVFTASVETTEQGGGAADDQTFSVSVTQEWAEGDSECPRCVPPCGPCELCTTPKSYDHVLWSMSVGHQSGSGLCWDTAGDPLWPYAPIPPDFTCLDNEGCSSFSGTYLLSACECQYFFHYPTFLEHYYPNPNPTPGQPNVGPPGVYADANQELYPQTCYPGLLCNGFELNADIRQQVGGPHDGQLYWYAWITENAEQIATWQSYWFPVTECRVPRTCYLIDPAIYCGEWPNTIHLEPML